MAKATPLGTTSNLVNPQDIARYVSISISSIIQQVNGNLTFKDNINNEVIDVSFTTSTLVQTIPHNLGRVPTMWYVGNMTTSNRIFQRKPPDINFLYLSASAAIDAKVMVV